MVGLSTLPHSLGPFHYPDILYTEVLGTIAGIYVPTNTHLCWRRSHKYHAGLFTGLNDLDPFFRYELMTFWILKWYVN